MFSFSFKALRLFKTKDEIFQNNKERNVYEGIILEVLDKQFFARQVEFDFFCFPGQIVD